MITIYAFIGDLHLCAGKLPYMDYVKSLNKFYGIIKSHKEECHAIFICGDLFDHKLSIDELEFASAMIVNIACNGCGRDGKHVPVYMIHGTYTHDYDQYNIFMPMLQKIDNIRVFYASEAGECVLNNGTRVLLLPQEYGDVDYSEWFSKQYDLIIGHGPIASENLIPCKSTNYEIMHSVELLGNISKLCVFGHFHGYTDFGNNVYYTGPWLRWKYGEDTDRVFFLCNDNFKVETYANDIAMDFVTIEINSPDELRSQVSQDITNPHRFIIHCKSDELNEYHAIMNAYKKNQYLKYQIISSDDDTDDIVLTENEHTVKPIIEPIPALIEYVKEKYEMDVSKEIGEYESKISKEEK